MPFAALIGGTIAPILLMLSPLAVMAVRHCDGWHALAKVAQSGKPPCANYRPPLM